MTWKPSKGWLLVKRIETEDKIGHLYITATSQQRIAGWTYEVVRSGGPAVDEEGMAYEFQPGDWILTPPRRTLEAEEENVLLLPEADVWAVIRV